MLPSTPIMGSAQWSSSRTVDQRLSPMLSANVIAHNVQRNAMRMSAEESSNRAQFIATSATVATSAVALPLGALADDEVRG